MAIEAWKFLEKQKQEKFSEKQKQEAIKKWMLQKELSQKTSIQESSDDSLSHLKDAIAHHDIDESVLKRVDEIATDGVLDKDEIQEILDIISEMESSEDIKKYLPTELIISQDEFTQALSDDNKRQEVLIKLDSALGHIYQQADGWTSSMWMIGMVALVLDKKLVTLQENHIDIKDILEKKDGKKNPWLIAQLKEIFLGNKR